MPKETKPSMLGPIEPATLYPLTILQERTGFGADAMRTARRSGLRVLYVAGRGFVLGGDFINFVEATATVAPKVAPSGSQIQKPAA